MDRLPEQGKPWYDGSGGVFIEVVDPRDDRWVFSRPELVGNAENADFRVGVVEFVDYLNAQFKKRASIKNRNLEAGLLAWFKVD